MAKTGRQSFQFMLRLPDELRDELRAKAETNNRSMNAEIVLRLERSLWLEANGFVSEQTTVLDLLEGPTGAQLVNTARFLRQQAADMIALLEAEENRPLVESAKEFVRREKAEQKLNSKPDAEDDHEG